MVNGRRNNVQPLAICRSLLNLLISNLLGRGIKHVTLDGRESVEVPIEAPSRNGTNSVLKPSSKSNGEIVIEFRHIEPTSNKNPHLALTEKKTDASRFEDLEKDTMIIHRQTINGSAPSDKETMTMATAQSLRPSLSKAPSNINEKAEHFIKSRKQAMGAYYNSS